MGMLKLSFDDVSNENMSRPGEGDDHGLSICPFGVGEMDAYGTEYGPLVWGKEWKGVA